MPIRHEVNIKMNRKPLRGTNGAICVYGSKEIKEFELFRTTVRID